MSEIIDREAYLFKRKQRYLKNKDAIKIQNKKWVDQNKQRHIEYNKKYKIENKNLILLKSKEYYKNNKVVIAAKVKAKREANIEFFNQRQQGYREALSPEQRLWYSNYKKEYEIKNKDILREKTKLRNENNRNKRRDYHNNRYRNDINYKILHNLRSRIKNTARRNKKIDKSVKLLGCTIEHLRNHLQELFTEGMTWELFMQGEIHVDHIKPCSKFDLSKPDEQLKCFHWTNLQPLWKVDNLKKGRKYAA